MSENGHSSTQRLWVENFDKLLRAWQNQIRTNRNLHAIEARRLKKRFYMIGVGTTVFGAIVTAVGLAFSQNPNMWVSIPQNVATGFVTALTGVMTFLGDDGNSSKHYEAANRYQALDLLLSNILVIPKNQREDPIEVLNSIREQFDDITSSSPMLPDTSLTDDLQWKYKKSSVVISSDHESHNDETRTSSESGDSITINVDLDSHPTSARANLMTNAKMQNELCGITNKNARYGVIAQMQYQLERMSDHIQNREDELS